MSNKESYSSIFLRRRTWGTLCALKRWYGRGAKSRLAETLNITRQHAGQIVERHRGVSTHTAMKIKRLLGIKDGECWCHLFEEVNLDNLDPNHPLFNQAKYDGEKPYTAYSTSALLRRSDYATEEREIAS